MRDDGKTKIAIALVFIAIGLIYAVWWVATCHSYWFQPILDIPAICLPR